MKGTLCTEQLPVVGCILTMCTCPSLVALASPYACWYAEAVAAITRKLRVGDGLDPTTNVGPLITKAALEKVRACVLALCVAVC